MPFKITVNGTASTVDAPPEMPLLWVLRDLLNLQATKYGCGIGQCGACTVHLAGKPVRACLTPLSAVGTQPVTTLEGLSADGTHPVQVAWQEIDVPVTVARGELDTMVSADESRAAAAALRNGRYVELPETKHPTELADVRLITGLLGHG